MSGLLIAFFQTTLLVVLVPNLVVAIGANYFGLSRAFLNFDYVIVGFVFALGFWRIGFVLFLVAGFFEIINLVSQVVPVFRLLDVFYLFNFIDLAPLKYKITLVFFLATYLVSFCVFKRSKFLGKNSGCLLALNMLTLFYVLHSLLGYKVSEAYRSSEASLVASQTVFSLNARRAGFVEGFSLEPSALEDSRYKAITESWLEPSLEDSPEKLLLVIAESWGVTDAVVQDEVLEPILSLSQSGFEIERGEIRFQGITIEAELRELCHKTVSHFNLRGIDSGFSDCLPNYMVNNNYETVSVHGAFGLMYDRVYWYPKVGFSESIFFESSQWKRRCYSFPGACDFELADRVSHYLKSKDRIFLYWLTLNSHAFYDERDIVSDDFQCELFGIQAGSAACRNLKLQRQFFESLSRVLEGLKGADIDVMVVGDHPPPILNRNEMVGIFSANKVPWIRIKGSVN